MAFGMGGENLRNWRVCDDGKPIVNTPVTAKPQYRVPSMDELRAVPENGLTHASTFSGAGGTCLGFRMAGFKTLWANDCDSRAYACYRHNIPSTILDPRPIQNVTADDILTNCGLEKGQLDVFEGSPPCTSFSTAGKRDKGWGENKEHAGVVQQKIEDLFFEWIRLMRELQPRAFVAENVSGLVKGSAKGYFKLILAEMKAAGYRVAVQVLDAQWLGVPQARQRVIFIGFRNDLNLDPAKAFPKPLKYRYSVRDALPWLSDIRMGAHGFKPETMTGGDKPGPTVLSSGLGSFDYDVGARGEVGLEGANGFDGHASKSIDQPAATVQAGRPVDVRVEQGGREAAGGKVISPRKRIDVTDRPALTIHADGKGSDVPKVVTTETPGRLVQKQYDGDYMDLTDQPSQAIIATSTGDKMPRVIHDAKGHPNYSRGDITDRPAPTLNAGAAGQIRVVQDTGGNGVIDLDVTDRPIPAVTSGNKGSNACHFIVEGAGSGEGSTKTSRVPGRRGKRAKLIHDTKGLHGSLGDVTDRPAPAIILGGTGGGQSQQLKVESEPERSVSPRARRADGEAPSPTLLASSSGFSDVAVERRKLTILEVKRLCSFPDDYDLTPAGGYAHQWARLGNSVPPVMAYHFAAGIRDVLLEYDRAK